MAFAYVACSKYSISVLQVLVETCSVLHGALEQARLGSLAHIEQVHLANLQARCTALVGKQE